MDLQSPGHEKDVEEQEMNKYLSCYCRLGWESGHFWKSMKSCCNPSVENEIASEGGVDNPSPPGQMCRLPVVRWKTNEQVKLGKSWTQEPTPIIPRDLLTHGRGKKQTSKRPPMEDQPEMWDAVWLSGREEARSLGKDISNTKNRSCLRWRTLSLTTVSHQVPRSM